MVFGVKESENEDTALNNKKENKDTNDVVPKT